MDLDHPDLKNKVVSSGRDFINDDLDASDDHGHGTMVAGIAAAETNNDEGMAGVAWNAMILPVKVLDESGNGSDGCRRPGDRLGGRQRGEGHQSQPRAPTRRARPSTTP